MTTDASLHKFLVWDPDDADEDSANSHEALGPSDAAMQYAECDNDGRADNVEEWLLYVRHVESQELTCVRIEAKSEVHYHATIISDKSEPRDLMTKENRMCYFIPADAYVKEHGWRVSIVIEGEPGHRPTGNWPYHGKIGETMPYFWGHDFDKAVATADNMNKRMDLSPEDVNQIVASSMAAGIRRKR